MAALVVMMSGATMRAAATVMAVFLRGPLQQARPVAACSHLLRPAVAAAAAPRSSGSSRGCRRTAAGLFRHPVHWNLLLHPVRGRHQQLWQQLGRPYFSHRGGAAGGGDDNDDDDVPSWGHTRGTLAAAATVACLVPVLVYIAYTLVIVDHAAAVFKARQCTAPLLLPTYPSYPSPDHDHDHGGGSGDGAIGRGLSGPGSSGSAEQLAAAARGTMTTMVSAPAAAVMHVLWHPLHYHIARCVPGVPAGRMAARCVQGVPAGRMAAMPDATQ